MPSANKILFMRLKSQHQKARNELTVKHVDVMQTLQLKHKKELECLSTLQQRESDEQNVKHLEELRSYDKSFTCKETNLQRLGPLNAWMLSRALNEQSATCSSKTKEKPKLKPIKTFKKKTSRKSLIRIKLNKIKTSLLMGEMNQKESEKNDLIEKPLESDIIMSEE